MFFIEKSSCGFWLGHNLNPLFWEDVGRSRAADVAEGNKLRLRAFYVSREA